MEAIIVLGYANNRAGELAKISKERIGRALALWKQFPKALWIVTGGTSPRYNPTKTPHYEYVMEYLRQRGVPPEAILTGLAGEYTAQEAALCAELVKKQPLEKLTLVTSDFHLARARWLFKKAMPQQPMDFVASQPSCWQTALLAKIFAWREKAYLEALTKKEPRTPGLGIHG